MDALEAGALEERGEILRAWESPDARRQVRVGLTAGEHAARERHEHVEPEPEERPEDALRPRDLENRELAAGPQHARELLQAAFEIREVPHAEADRRGVEVAVRKRKRERVTLHPFDRARLLASALEHLRREVERDDATAAPLGLDGEIARSAARVEHAVSRPYHRVHGELAPPLIEAGRHHAVHDVVHGSDAIEHPAHRLGLEPSGLVGHAGWPQRSTSALSIPI